MTENPETAERVAEIAAAYAVDGPALELGALLWDGVCDAGARVRLPLAMLNRHALVAGASGTGKTKTLQLMAEQLSEQGVPVFLADIKGDISGISAPGVRDQAVTRRAAEVGQEWRAAACPCEFYALGGVGAGIPLRTAMTAFGPLLLAQALGLGPAEEHALGQVFHYADRRGLELESLRDLRAVLAFLRSEPGRPELKNIDGLTPATAGTLLRVLTVFESQGADAFFGTPGFDSAELLRQTPDGRGVVSVLELPGVQDRPRLFSTFLMWLLADLCEALPEAVDGDKPRLVFFVDEAHLLFDGASPAFLAAITQTVRLIRSRGVGVVLVAGAPPDVPSAVLGQLGSRVQHALRVVTPEDDAALRATVRTFPASRYDLPALLTSLGIGEAAVTLPGAEGAPTPVAATRLRAPQSRMGPVPPSDVEFSAAASPLFARYAQAVERESAYEKLTAVEAFRIAAEERRAAARSAAEPAAGRAALADGEAGDGQVGDGQSGDGQVVDGQAGDGQAGDGQAGGRWRPPLSGRRRVSRDPAPADAGDVFEALARSAGERLGREVPRSVFGTRRRR